MNVFIVSVELTCETCTLWLNICQSAEDNHEANPILLIGEKHNINIAATRSLWILFWNFIAFYTPVIITFLVSVGQCVYCLMLRWQNVPSGINKVNHIWSYLLLSHIHGTPGGYYRPTAPQQVVSWCLLALKIDLSVLHSRVSRDRHGCKR